MGHDEMIDMEGTETDYRDKDVYKARDDLSDGEQKESYKGRDELTEPEGRKKDHNKTWDKDKTKEKDAEVERLKDYERERDSEPNLIKEKIRDRDRHKDRDREKDRGRERDKERDREQDRDKIKDREEDREKHRVKDRDKAKDRESGKEKEKAVSLKHRDKEKDREKGKEKDQRKLKEKDREQDREMEREKNQEAGNRDTEKQKDRAKEHGRSIEIERDLDVVRDRKEKEREKEREREKDRDKEEREKDREKIRDKDRDKERDKDREKERDKERIRDREKGRDRGKERNRDRDREKESDRDKEREREKERLKAKDKESKDGGKIRKKEVRGYDDDAKDKEKNRERNHEEKTRRQPEGSYVPTTELEERLTKIREERVKGDLEGGPEISAWVSKSRKLEEHRNAEKKKAARLAKIFEEQDNVDDTESDDEEKTGHTGKDLAGLKVLHGLDKVMEGGAVVLTLKDQNILSGGDVNDEMDVLENTEIGEQNSRNEAYKAAKKKPGIYEDKFQNDINALKTILPQYDDPFKEEEMTLDETGGINEEAQKKLEEIRKRLQGAALGNRFEESLDQPGTNMSDYYTHDEMLQFKKPKKKKKLRKKDKLDVDALEAEAITAGLGIEDLGSRDRKHTRALREEAEKAEAEHRKNAYETAYSKAAEASRGLRDEKPSDTMQVDEEDGYAVFGGEDDELYKSLEKARQVALKKQAESIGSGPQAVARLAVAANRPEGDLQNQALSDTQENKVVFTEMEEFVWSLQLDEDTHKPVVEDVFKEDDEGPAPVKQEDTAEAIGGWTEVKEMDASQLKAEEEEVVPDETIKEVSVGKGLAGALQLLKERGTLKETVDWGGRNMDKKKSKLIGVRDNDGPKEILLDRLDEFGRVMTPKEAFRKLSHKFHGKGPGKMKQEKRMKQYHEELKLKQMNTGDTPLMSMEKMRDVQAKLRTPYIVLSGQIKPGQTSDPRSGFATVEKEAPGSLTPMLGDRKVEHFLGIKRKPEGGTMGPPKKPKT
eukprot:Gb_12198 [translate_table: standard]